MILRQIDPTIYEAVINGETVNNITPASRFWPEIQAYIAAGGAVLPQYTLDELRQKKHEEIKQAFDNQITTGYTVNNIKFDCDFDSLNKLDVLAKLAEYAALTTVDVRDYNNVTHALTIADFKAALVTIGGYIQQQFAKKNTLQDQAKTATEEQLALIRW